MARMTIDFGIDLGTTNSSMAMVDGTAVRVFKNNDGLEYTPSAVYYDRKNSQYVGKSAYERSESDPDNTAREFKSAMGTTREFLFARSGRRLTAPQLSAEVLKSLRGDVKQRMGEDVQAAVITVPAAFELPQCDATLEAAKLAGFTASPLLQEPVAAALAYGYQSETERAFWLVYDLGGGTFDAAVIQTRDGMIQVVNHGGDNHLGGKLIDWEIVDQLLIPALKTKGRFGDLRRGKPEWLGAVAKLKYAAEAAKIRLSRASSATIEVTINDERNEPVEFEYELTKAELEGLAEPFIVKSINICRKVLSERRLGAGDVEKVLMVGGPTLIPYLRERVASALGIPLEVEKDPLTVVAQGAAVFAATQRATTQAPVVRHTGQFAVELDYKPVGSDLEPLIGGRVIGATGQDLSTMAIEFVNTVVRPEWRSGKVGLSPNGAFVTQLWAEKGPTNVFTIELTDATGRRHETVPDRFPYNVGLVMTDPPLIHSVGVGLANNEVVWCLEKGAALPARGKKTVLRTVTEVRRNNPDHRIRIPILEGGSRRADRNQEIGAIEIPSSRVKRDVPANSEVEVTIVIDKSRILTARAYLPILDEEFDAEVNFNEYRKKGRAASELRADVARQKVRLDEARRRASETGDARAAQALQRIDSERMVHYVEASLEAAEADPDAADKCAKGLLDLKAALDEVDDALEWPALVAQAQGQVEAARAVIMDAEYKATPEEKASFAALDRDIRSAIAARHVEPLRVKASEIERLGHMIALRHPGVWVAHLQFLESKRDTMTNRTQADAYIAQGRRAINQGDVEGLKAAVVQLIALLPAGDADRERLDSFSKSTVQK